MSANRLQILDDMRDERIIRYYVHLLILVTVALRTAVVVRSAVSGCAGWRGRGCVGSVNGAGISDSRLMLVARSKKRDYVSCRKL